MTPAAMDAVRLIAQIIMYGALICVIVKISFNRSQWRIRATTAEHTLKLLSESDFLTALRAANIARQIEWQNGQEISLEYRGNEAAGEMGEFCNVIKKLARERLGIKGSRATLQDLKEEGADVVICVDLIFKEFGIDLAEAVREKFNMTSDKVGLATKL